MATPTNIISCYCSNADDDCWPLRQQMKYCFGANKIDVEVYNFVCVQQCLYVHMYVCTCVGASTEFCVSKLFANGHNRPICCCGCATRSAHKWVYNIRRSCAVGVCVYVCVRTWVCIAVQRVVSVCGAVGGSKRIYLQMLAMTIVNWILHVLVGAMHSESVVINSCCYSCWCWCWCGASAIATASVVPLILCTYIL